jgi:cell shape-determining protein MreC
MWTIFFSRKTSIEWIKFMRTVISILYLIIFYLILLHVQKVMKTVVLIGWILDVMEL